jgi:hypothetical protein
MTSPPVVLFLDFDGVLHSSDDAVLDESSRLVPSPKLFRWTPLLEEALSPYPEVRIVVSSDWRRLFDDDALVKLLGVRLGERFIGVVQCFGGSRRDEILEEARRRELVCWLAIDDHPTVVKARKRDKRFIACAPEIGLSSPLVQRELQRKLAALVTGTSGRPA